MLFRVVLLTTSVFICRIMIGVEQWRFLLELLPVVGEESHLLLWSVSSTVNISESWYGVDIGGFCCVAIAYL